MLHRRFNHVIRQRHMVLAVAMALGLGCGAAQAQSTVGSVFGTADAGAKVEVINLGNNQSREVTVEKDGKFNVSSVQPGTYRVNVTENGQTTSRDIRVVAGQGFNLNLATAAAPAASAQQLSTINVVANALPAIDVSSVQTATVLTADQMKSLPIARNQTSVALLAPGVSRGDSAFGNLASVGGASVAENSYYVNGFNVSNMFQSLTFSEVPFEAIDQEEVQNGGYGPEYGNSTGGVISVQTKRGTNEWKGGADITYNPEFWQAKQKNIYENNGTLFQSNALNRNFLTGNAANAGAQGGGGGGALDFSTRWNAWLGGPVIKDKLFVFALVGGTRTTDAAYGSTQAVGPGYDKVKTTNPTYLVKLDWNINASNLLEYTGFDNTRKRTTSVYDYNYDANNVPYHYNYLGQIYDKTGGANHILKYTSYITDDFSVQAMYGESINHRSNRATAANGVQESYDGNIFNAINAPGCPAITDSRNAIVNNVPGVTPYTNYSCSFVGTLGIPNSKDTTKNARLDLEYKLGDHDLTAGWQQTRFKTFAGAASEGGAGFTYQSLPTAYLGYDATPNPVDSVVQATTFATGAKATLQQKAFYLQDKWQITSNLLLRIGVRNDGFKDQNGQGQDYVKMSNSWQPRLGFSWDVHGDSTLKVYGSAGDYSLPLDAEVSLRGASASLFGYQFYTYTGVDPKTGKPLGLAPVPAGLIALNTNYAPTIYNGETGVTPNPHSSAATNLRPFKQREFILGAQQQVQNWTFGVKGTYRKVINGTDDSCDLRPVYAYANAHFGTNLPTNQLGSVDPNIPGGCFIYNPGSSASLLFPLDTSGKLYPINLNAAQIGEPAYKRKYEALELTAERAFDNRFYVKASYVWSRLWGNTEGLVNSNNKQTDTGTSYLFDYPELMIGSNGYLPNDHRHTFKVYGAWQINEEWTVGANGVFQTGIPISCYGLNPIDGTIGGAYGTGVYNMCHNQQINQGSAGRTPNTWNVDANVQYKPHWVKGLTLRANVFNVFNKQMVTSVNQSGETGQTGGTSLFGSTYKMPTAFQPPRYVQLNAEYDFSL
ncbi:TonB-dependent receptor [Dyella subtropica]|uniref:TonB-dependent receptor n=1 Tax=Dyella subtropica TaxID=2992127 RepID=UPI002255DCB3|nr:TonB-dependent receptor [Dyella subtropica]